MSLSDKRHSVSRQDGETWMYFYDEENVKKAIKNILTFIDTVSGEDGDTRMIEQKIKDEFGEKLI